MLVIGQDELVVIVPPVHSFAGRSGIHVRDLAGQSFIAHSEPSADRARVLDLLEGSARPHHIVLAVPSLDALKRAIEVGVGITIMPRRCALTELHQGRLVAIPLVDAAERPDIWLVSGARADMSRISLLFMDVVTRRMQASAERSPPASSRPAARVGRR